MDNDNTLHIDPELIRQVFDDQVISAISSSISHGNIPVEIKSDDLLKIDLSSFVVTGFGWTDPIGQLQGWLTDRFKELASWFASTVSTSFKTFFDTTIKPALDWIVSSIRSIITTIISGLTEGVNWIRNNLSSIANTIVSSITGTINALGNMVRQVYSYIETGIRGIVSSLSSMFTYIQNALASIPNVVISGVKGFIDTVISGIASLGQTLQSTLSSIWSGISQAIAGITNLFRSLWEWLASTFNQVSSTLSSISNNIITTLSKIPETIMSGVRSFIDLIISGIQNLGSSLSELVTRVWDGINQAFAGITNLFRSLWEWMGSVFDRLISGINQFTQYLYSFGAMVMGGIQNIYNFILQIPEIFKNIFQSISDFFTWLYNSLVSFVSSPVEWIRVHIVDPLWNGLQWLGSRIFEGAQWLWDTIVNGVQWLWQKIQEGIQWLVSVIQSGIQWIIDGITYVGKVVWNALVSFFTGLYEFIKGIISTGFNVLSRIILQPITGFFSNLVSERGIHSPEWSKELFLQNKLMGMATSILAVYGINFLFGGLLKMLGYSLKGYAMTIGCLVGTMELAGKLFGVGGSWEIDLGKAMGSLIYNIGEWLQSIPEQVSYSTTQGIGLWIGNPLARLFFAGFADYLPMYIPPVALQLEIVRRGWIADGFPDVVTRKEEIVAFTDLYLNLMMMPSFYRRLLLDDNFYMVITDRFYQQRRIPLSLRYNLPSPSEVVRWLIRDIVIPPVVTKEFIEQNMNKLLGMRGYPSDIGKLYYIAHFKYPPPSKLAEFYWRSLSRLLWLPDNMEEPAIAEVVRAPTRALSPRDLNKIPFTKIHDAMDKYWRWHDYAPFSWIANPNDPSRADFTTDKAIMVELIADLPTRTDLRWMARWGIFEHLISITKDPMVDLDAIVQAVSKSTGKELYSTKVTPSITFDVRLLSRFLISTGVIPDLASILAVAQVHQVLADELTLTRTGFIAGFREGVLSLDSTEQLMSGMFTIEFTTGYIKPVTGEWVDVTYRKPMLWLPAERRLLQLRAVFDRHIDLWKDFMREVVNGVRRLAFTGKTALEYMKEYFNDLAKSWSRDIKAISGVDWSPVLDEPYIALWIKYAEMTRIIEARIWVRNYLARLMGWLLYRVSYGWLSKEDYTELINSVQEKEWLTPVEAEFFMTIFDWLSGVVRKEYIPTPHTLATFSEYMVIPEDTVKRVFELQKVPEEFRQFYEEYIRVRPVKSDYKSLLTAYRRAYTRGFITEDQWKQILSEARSYGFRDIEISIIQRLADIEMLMRNRDEYIPTLSQLIQFSEYVGLPDELIERVLRIRKVDEPWASLWKQLIKARVLSDDVRVLLNAYLRVIRSGFTVPDELRKQVEQYFSMVGITIEEIKIRELAIQLEMTIEYVPTLSQLVQFAEYTGIPEDLVRQILQARRVGEPWASLWIQLIKARVVADDVRILINSYYRAIRSGAVIPDDVRRQVEQYFKLAGITSEELAIRDLAVQLDLLTETLPSPSTLVSMSEYIDIPVDYLTEILQRRRLEKRFIDLWLRYVQVRMINTEVNRIVSVFERIYERYSVPDDMVNQIRQLMAQGGWTSSELQLFTMELELRRTYRILMMIIPTIRGAISDLLYLPDYDKLFNDLLKAYGIDITRFKEQVEYYRRLLKNRRLWRHFSWWRSQLAYAYQYGAITLDQARRMLESWKTLGLVDDDEINKILEALELRKHGYIAYRSRVIR